MAKFYFTYGSDSRQQPHRGGWTVVIAPDRETACRRHVRMYGRSDMGLIRCCGIYDEATFEKTGLANTGNFNRFRIDTLEAEECDMEDER